MIGLQRCHCYPSKASRHEQNHDHERPEEYGWPELRATCKKHPATAWHSHLHLGVDALNPDVQRGRLELASDPVGLPPL